MIGVSNYVFVDKIMYSGIPLIQQPWYWTDAALSIFQIIKQDLY